VTVVWVILVLAVLAVLAGVAFATALAIRGSRHAAANLALGPGMSTDVQAEWAAHTPEAKLHRRLGAAARSLATVPLGDALAIERRVAAEQRILELNRSLIAAAAAPAVHRDEVVSALEPEVAATEAEVAALAKSAATNLHEMPWRRT
jgi:hypothetical protein